MARTQAAARRTLARRIASIEGQQTQLTSSQQYLLGAARLASPQGRLHPRAPAPAPLMGHTGQGNSAVTSDARGGPAAQPGKGPGGGIGNASPWPARLILTAPSQLLRRARTPAFQNDALVARDRRISAYRGTVMLSGTPDTKPGIPDPDADGPARPSYRMINRTLSWQIGTDSTTGLDNSAAKPMTRAGRRPFSLGTRGDPWTTVYGGTPRLAAYRPYGTRGGPRGGPQPRITALPGGQYRPGTLLQAGAPGDGPQKIASGPAWGLHTATAEPVKLTGQVITSRFSQVRPPRINRPLNSRAAGQSMSQAAVHLDGTAPVKIPLTKPGVQPGVNARFRRTR